MWEDWYKLPNDYFDGRKFLAYKKMLDSVCKPFDFWQVVYYKRDRNGKQRLFGWPLLGGLPSHWRNLTVPDA